MQIRKYFSSLSFSDSQTRALAKKVVKILDEYDEIKFRGFSCESCFYVISHPDSESMNEQDEKTLIWLLSKPHSEASTTIQTKSFFKMNDAMKEGKCLLLEYGPRLSYTTAFSTNAVSACRAAGLRNILRLERSFRYRIHLTAKPKEEIVEKIGDVLHDRMTECQYITTPATFDLPIQPQPPFLIDVCGRGLDALREANQNLGLSFDEDDMKYYLHLFRDTIKRNPTNVELFDLAQSNSEHSRHWFFKGRMIVDGKEEPISLLDMVMDTQKYSNQNNVIKFCDNSSGIEGFSTEYLSVKTPSESSKYENIASKRHIIYTAETHNFPTGVCPFPGAATGTGGRIRDVQAAGRGGHVIAGMAGYCFGNLNIPGYALPWENSNTDYPSNLASPVDICIQASNGASDYGNKFGEPVICGFARSCGLRVPGRERMEWVKPIMFSGGVGSIDHAFLRKEEPEKGMHVVKLGGPVYRIGVGGGSASSVHIQGGDEKRSDELDFGAVQRGDPEMEHKLNRVIRACVEMGPDNPIASIHDQGAGGNANVLKEIVEGAGAVINADAFELGDKTINILELWVAEYQESDAVLARPEKKAILESISRRERCQCSFVGTVSSDNKVILKNFTGSEQGQNPVELPLDKVLASMPPKVFHFDTPKSANVPLQFPSNLTAKEALERVLRLPSVASKRYLTNKVDRSVTGLIAQQQCVGPLHTPVSDVAVVALSYFDTVGSAVAIGEQPIKGLVNPECGARMAVAEALTNLVFAPISGLKDVKCSANWMWAAKLPGEGAKLLSACKAMCGVMGELGIAVDGGKDSLSMAAKVGSEVVKAPGSLVISVYAPCTDITRVVTPDLKCPDGKGTLIYVRFGPMNQHRLGGSALAQCFEQVGDDSPDLKDPKIFASAFNVTQQLIKEDLVCSGHDISDGGLVTAILEMAFAGNCSIDIQLPTDAFQGFDPIQIMFAEETGIVLEVKRTHVQRVMKRYKEAAVPCLVIGHSEKGSGTPYKINIDVHGKRQLEDGTSDLAYWRSVWEQTSFELDKLQCDEKCAQEEQEVLKSYRGPTYNSMVGLGAPAKIIAANAPRVAIVREEGSNGDREMAAAYAMAGFEVWDVCMQDLLDRKMDLNRFRGLAFVGGFSYADVLGSAKGWASGILFNSGLSQQFDHFYSREDTFSMGICNGCQLMCLLGWVGSPFVDAPSGVYLDHNESGRYESRFSTVKICNSQSIFFNDMAGSTLGVWVSHGEGKFVINDENLLYQLELTELVALRYVDDAGNVASQYPLNPNGSPNGIAGLCSIDGRHLALMPHPERSFLSWQWPNWPGKWAKRMENGKATMSPWFKMFQNAYEWCGRKEW